MISSTINVRFDEDTTLRFVELYRDQRLLWDKGHKSYNIRADRLNAYRRIVHEMAIERLGVSEVVAKIKSIRSTYQQELRKIRSSARRHAAQDAASLYVPKLQWFPIMESMIGGSGVEQRLRSRASDEKMSSTDCAKKVPFNCYDADNGGEDASSIGEIQQLHQSFEYSSLMVQEHQQSSIELFSKYIASSLESLPPFLAVLAQKDMHDILVDYKIMEINQD